MMVSLSVRPGAGEELEGSSINCVSAVLEEVCSSLCLLLHQCFHFLVQLLFVL